MATRVSAPQRLDISDRKVPLTGSHEAAHGAATQHLGPPPVGVASGREAWANRDGFREAKDLAVQVWHSGWRKVIVGMLAGIVVVIGINMAGQMNRAVVNLHVPDVLKVAN